MPEGDYFVHIASSNFVAGGLLEGLISVPGNSADNGVDDNVVGSDNGIDSSSPETTGISSEVITLALGAEPTGAAEGGKAGADDDAADADADLTVDFALVGPRDYGDAPDSYLTTICLLYTSPSPRDLSTSRMPSSA